jgi:hypothetical protein
MSRTPDIPWTPWQPLFGAWKGDNLPNKAGLYRIRRIGFNGIDYIGQTGSGTMTIKKRMGMLRGVWKDEMPYRDPHTAGPALWSLRRKYGVDLEVSGAAIEDTTPNRKGMEALATALYRQASGASPTVNFGRMPLGFVMSSPNNRRLVEAGKRFRGGASTEVNQSHEQGLGPAGTLLGEPHSLDWCGFSWSPWQPVDECAGFKSKHASGLYRIAGTSQSSLLYIGEGKIVPRLLAHAKKVNRPDHDQGAIFRHHSPLRFSCIENNDWQKHHRLEFENDLIAAHLLSTGSIPTAQFLG